jgi:hypothetical protein
VSRQPSEADRGGRWRAAGVVVFAITGFLLVSLGGAIVAAPVTVPVMFLAASRHPTSAFRVTTAVLGSLTVAEAVWAVTYLAVDEAKPRIWLLPMVAGLAFAVAVAKISPSDQPEAVG